jgi:ParB family chromosome partitioning protein
MAETSVETSVKTSVETSVETSVVIFEKASLMLAEADTIQKVKEFKTLALTAADLARRKGMGEKAIQYARSYALQAERKMGEMLAATERAKRAPGPGRGKVGRPARPTFTAIPTLSELGLTKDESARAQKLAALSEEKFKEITDGVISLKEALSSPHVAKNTGENEWYTPPEYIEAAKSLMGRIDLDPASSRKANEIVGANKYFSMEDDGLSKKWAGKVWLNPPYSQPLISSFSEAVSRKYETGEITEACVLVNNATETSWFQRMLKVTAAVCFPSGRIRFINKDGKPFGAPLQGQAILYFGKNKDEFGKVFSKFGVVLFRK